MKTLMIAAGFILSAQFSYASPSSVLGLSGFDVKMSCSAQAMSPSAYPADVTSILIGSRAGDPPAVVFLSGSEIRGMMNLENASLSETGSLQSPIIVTDFDSKQTLTYGNVVVENGSGSIQGGEVVGNFALTDCEVK